MMSAIQSREIDFAAHVSCIQLEEMSFQLRGQTLLTLVHPFQYVVKQE